MRPPDIADDQYEAVLEEAVRFIESHWKHEGEGLAVEAMKTEGQTVWHGMGNYSSSECFTRAGEWGSSWIYTHNSALRRSSDMKGYLL